VTLAVGDGMKTRQQATNAGGSAGMTRRSPRG